MNPEDFTQYREQCESYRQRLVTSRNEVLDAYGKTLTTLSGGAIGLSITFLKDVLKLEGVISPWMMSAAWMCWTICLALTVFALFVSQKAHSRQVAEYDSYLAGDIG